VLSRSRHLTARLRRLDPVRIDWILAACLLVGIEIQVWTAPHQHAGLAVAIYKALLCVAVAVRRRRLFEAIIVLAAIAIVGLLVFGSSASGPGGVASAMVPLLLFYGAGAFLAEPRAWLALALGTVLVLISALESTMVLANLVFDVPVFAVLPFLVGRWARERAARERASRERAERLDAGRELRVRAAALGERARLAREIHDVIAHSVSVMVIQAAGARTVMDSEPTRAQEALMSVERAGREALAEMRRLLGALGDGQELRALAPQPGIDDLPDLISRTQAAGLPASIRVVGDPVAVAPGLSLCAYRLVQEALTNAIKHAGPARAAVSVRWQADALELEVADDGHGIAASADRAAGGHGLVGMRERAALHGGSVEAGPGLGGGFAVRARIPFVTGSPA
jgi:signal transduction histidine kinase